MSKGLKKAGKIIGGIKDWMVIVLFTAMVVVTMAIVLCRYVFKGQWRKLDKIEGWRHI